MLGHILTSCRSTGLLPALSPAHCRSFHYGGASSSGLASFLTTRQGEGRPEALARRPWPRTGLGSGGAPWSIPRVIFGLDDHGSPATDRASLLFSAVTAKGCNAMLFNGDDLLQRAAASPLPLRSFDLHWEALTLRRLLSKAVGVQRSEVMVGATLALSPSAGHATLEPRTRALLSALHMQRLDFLLVMLPREERAWALREHAQALAEACEALVGQGLLQYYGIGCASFHAEEQAAAGAGAGAAAAAESPAGQHLPSLLAALEHPAVTGAAARTRAALLAAHAASSPSPPPLVLGNTQATPLTGSEGGEAAPGVYLGASEGAYEASAAAAADAAQQAGAAATSLLLGSSSHHCAALAVTANLLTLSPALLRTAAPAAAAHGLALLALSPLDCYARQSAVTASAEAWRAAGRYAAWDADPAVPRREPTPFRCAEAPLHSEAASHPALTAPMLNDTLNFGCHLEELWEREVRAAALAEAASSGSGSGAAAAAAAAAGKALEAVGRTDASWARILGGSLARLDSLLHWQWIKRRRLVPGVTALVLAASKLTASAQWASTYRLVMGDLTGAWGSGSRACCAALLCAPPTALTSTRSHTHTLTLTHPAWLATHQQPALTCCRSASTAARQQCSRQRC